MLDELGYVGESMRSRRWSMSIIMMIAAGSVADKDNSAKWRIFGRLSSESISVAESFEITTLCLIILRL